MLGLAWSKVRPSPLKKKKAFCEMVGEGGEKGDKFLLFPVPTDPDGKKGDEDRGEPSLSDHRKKRKSVEPGSGRIRPQVCREGKKKPLLGKEGDQPTSRRTNRKGKPVVAQRRRKRKASPERGRFRVDGSWQKSAVLSGREKRKRGCQRKKTAPKGGERKKKRMPELVSYSEGEGFGDRNRSPRKRGSSTEAVRSHTSKRSGPCGKKKRGGGRGFRDSAVRGKPKKVGKGPVIPAEDAPSEKKRLAEPEEKVPFLPWKGEERQVIKPWGKAGFTAG